ncbi:cation:proton antiporter [Terasakiella sp. A23]|uniref:cation:proton antiporter n=1 Tax=Terasakiella sp. FCG-A23 TaxID=3080561 RepID=UPI0029542758|nr:cation:proton antiporter [Terasakiella sp. A23]MDV7339603.1 cation:proton antiporter [Terasakiella sp. A23]
MDPALPLFLTILLILLGISLIGVLSKQPVIIGYLIAGIAIGPAGFALVTDPEMLTRLGAIGVVLLLFFIGMEISPAKIKSNLLLAGIGTLAQITITVLVLVGIGEIFDWPLNRSVLLGFVVALSSTAVILKLLEDWGELQSKTGQDVLAILLAQDVLVVPMILIVGYLAGSGEGESHLVLQGIGAVILVGFAVFVVTKKNLSLPFGNIIRKNHELQVLMALFVCFGLALISGLFELSTALGAFVGGMFIHATKDTNWVEHSLLGFKVIFIAMFFVSVGLLVDIPFFIANAGTVLGVAFLALFLNTALNTFILRLFKRSWKDSLYGGALLAQIGEFSFVLGELGFKSGVINTFGNQLVTLIIACTLLASPAWIIGVKYLSERYCPDVSPHLSASEE